jgi:outer membrane receptor protein involved in Fe transport
MEKRLGTLLAIGMIMSLICGSRVDGAATTLPGTEPAGIELESPPAMPVVPAVEPSTQPALSAPPVAPRPSVAATQSSEGLSNVLITANLDEARSQIAPSLGATAYTVGLPQIQVIPQGDNAPFQQVLLRMPSVVTDSFGQYHVRGEHADLTYRVNGVILPEPLNGFGQELDTHLVDSVTLIDGTLPAQFGFRTAGIVDVTTKSGASLQSNEIAAYGGRYGTFQPSFEVGGNAGQWDYFVTGSYKQNSLGIENPTGDRTAIHDDTEQTKLFAYLAYHIDDTSRLTFMLNGSYANFQIPNTPGLPQQFALSGVPFYSSSDVNENQNEQNYYGVIAYQKSTDDFSMQVSGFTSYGQIHFVPDPIGDLIFQGVAGDILNSFTTEGVQADASYIINPQHTLRFGAIANYTAERNDADTSVFAVDPITGAVSNVPETILDNTNNNATSAGMYVQDEWKLTPTLTLNYGARFDKFDANFDQESQLSPRVNLVWKMSQSTTFHIGYARYFDPPPVQYVPPSSIAKFANTTNAPDNFIDDPPKVERSNYYDAGLSHQFSKAWSGFVDGYYKQADNLIDLGQFGQAVILSPFNYAQGHVYGAETGTSYKQGNLSAFGNFGWVLTGGKDIDSQQFLIDTPELNYIQNNFIKLDHESEFTASGGAAYNITPDDLAYVDILYGSGLRAGFANQNQEPFYYPVNVGYQHVFHTAGPHGNTVTVRFDVINVFDQSYQLRNGTGIGVSAPQYGQRRTFLGGIAYDF